MPYSLENPMKSAFLQLLVMVAKGKKSSATMTHGCKGYFSFETMTDGCKEANFSGFSQYIYENELTSENMYLSMNLAKKSQFHFSLFKVDFQNPKSKLEYLSFKKNTVFLN